MKKLFEEVRLNHLTVKNRLVRSATWEGVAAPDGSISEEAYAIYDELARGGVGLIINGFTSVSTHDFYFDGMMRLSEDRLIPQYRKLTDIVHATGVPIIAQLALGAYYHPQEGGGFAQVEPDEMRMDEIMQVIHTFGDAARRAKEAGFDGVQIHAAHFFFLSRFISPRINHRTDAYGGSAKGRTKILCDILADMRAKAEGLHITIKMNMNDFTPGGLTEEEALAIGRLLDTAGIDSIEVSGNGTSVPGIRAHVNEGYFVPFAARLAKEVTAPVIAVGGLRSRAAMEDVLRQTDIALLALSRPLLREPDLPQKLMQDAHAVSACISCNRCYSSPCHRCVFRK